jgi:hypothetical protein
LSSVSLFLSFTFMYLLCLSFLPLSISFFTEFTAYADLQI